MKQYTIKYCLDDSDKSRIGTHYTKAMDSTHAQETFIEFMEQMEMPFGSIVSITKQPE